MPWEVDREDLLPQGFQAPHMTIPQIMPTIAPDLSNLPDPIEFPEHGTMKVFSELERVAKFEIITSDEGAYYYIKLKPTGDAGGDIVFYLDKNTTFETMVPLGIYELLFAVGNTWYGDKELFGPYATYLKTNTLYEFYIDDNDVVWGLSQDLKRHVLGSLHSQPVDPSEFQ